MLERVFRKYPILDTFYKGIISRVFQIVYRDDGINIIEEEWDNLVILDACRFDSFLKTNWVDGELRKVISRGSHTGEWIKRNFQEDCSGIVYVAANPHFSGVKLKEILGRNPFHHVEDVWDYGWDEEWGNVPPERVTESAIKVSEKYPEKRLIIHYNQPHNPFPPESEVSSSLLKSLELESREWDFLCELSILLSKIFPGVSSHLKTRKREIGEGKRTPWLWGVVRDGIIDKSKVISAYEENLITVLGEVENILGQLEGETIITADHGNMFGEYGIYGHPPGLRFKELVEVPWFKVHSGDG